MSVKHALLVLLQREPASGYDLARRFNRGIGQFWQASHQQIYQQLKALHQQDWARFTVAAQAGKPDRKIYRITRTGHSELQRWLADAHKPPTIRDALLIKIYAASDGEPAQLRSEIQRHLVLHQALLDQHRAQERDYFAADEATRRRLRWPYMTLRRGIRYEQEWISWLEDVLQLLANDALPDQPLA